MVAKYSTKITSKMLLTVAPPVCVAKYSTTKNNWPNKETTIHTQRGTLKLNSVNAVELKNKDKWLLLPLFFLPSCVYALSPNYIASSANPCFLYISKHINYVAKNQQQEKMRCSIFYLRQEVYALQCLSVGLSPTSFNFVKMSSTS